MTSHATSPTASSSARGASRRRFARHFGEMLLAMFAGMLVLGGLAQLAFAVAGSGLDETSGAVRVLIMGFSMTAPMVAWMRHRGHDAARSVEMAGSMVVPSLLAAILAAVGALDAGAALALQHAVMIPAMLGVMLWRHDHYAHAH